MFRRLQFTQKVFLKKEPIIFVDVKCGRGKIHFLFVVDSLQWKM